MSNSFYSDVVDYVEQTSRLIDDLSQRTSFSEGSLRKTAEALVAADLVSAGSAERLVEAFRANPDKALESLVKVAASTRPSAKPLTVGSPAGRTGKPADTGHGQGALESDVAFLKSFRLA